MDNNETVSVINENKNRIEEYFEDNLAGIKDAAYEEYLETLICGVQVTKISELNEKRLYLLIKHVYKTIPTEYIVSGVFGISETSARTLIRNVLSKYKYKLNSIITESVRNIFASIVEDMDDTGYRTFYCDSVLKIEILNNILRQHYEKEMDIVIVKIQKIPCMVNRYKILEDSYKIIEQYFKGEQNV